MVYWDCLNGLPGAELLKQLKGLSSSLTLRVLSLASTALSGFVLAKLLGPAEFGVYGHAMAIVSLAAIFSALGTETFLLREIGRLGGRAIAAADRRLLIGFSLSVIMKSGTVVALVLVLVTLFSTESAVAKLGDIAFLVLPVTAVFLALIAAAKGIAKGERRLVLAQFPDGIVRPLLVLLFCVCLLLLGVPIDASVVVLVFTLSVVLTFAIQVIGLKPYMSLSGVGSGQRREWLTACAHLLFVASVMLLNRRLDILMLGFMVDARETGAYILAVRFSDLVTVGATAFAISVSSDCARWLRTGEVRRLKTTLTTGARVVFLITVCLVLCVGLIGPSLMAWFDTGYLAAESSLYYLLITQVVTTAFGLNAMLLVLSGDESWCSKMLLASAAFNALLNLGLIRLLGIQGAAIATLFATLAWNLAAWLRVRQSLAIDTSVLGLQKG